MYIVTSTAKSADVLAPKLNGLIRGCYTDGGSQLLRQNLKVCVEHLGSVWWQATMNIRLKLVGPSRWGFRMATLGLILVSCSALSKTIQRAIKYEGVLYLELDSFAQLLGGKVDLTPGQWNILNTIK